MDFAIMCTVCGLAMAPGVEHHHGAPLQDTQTRERVERATHYAVIEHRVILIAKPLAGVDAIATVPQMTRWRVQNLQAQLVTSAAVANRVVHLVIDDGQGNQLYNFPAPGNQVAGLTVQYSAADSSISTSFDGATTLVLPDPLHLLQGWRIGFKTTALDGADQWSAFGLIVKEWLNF